MPRTVPSQPVAYIDANFQFAKTEQHPFPYPYLLDVQFVGPIAALVRLVDELPGEFLTMDSGSYNTFVRDVETMRGMVEQWDAKTAGPSRDVFNRELVTAVTDLRMRLIKLDDQAIRTETPEVSFIEDVDLRASIRGDVAAARQAFNDHEWKGATVLAGAVVEALPHWSLANHRDTSKVFAKLQTAGEIGKGVNSDLDYWTLEIFKKVAADVGLIKGDTIALIGLAQNFRNLIHPGKANRTRERCSLSTAHTALGAMERLIEQFSSS